MLKFKAAVTNIHMHDTETGYSVLRVKPTSDTDDKFFERSKMASIVVYGYASELELGQRITVEGLPKEHKTYGQQIAASAIYPTKLTAREHAQSFLLSGVIRSIERSDAMKIWSTFGDQSLAVIAESPNTLVEKGVLNAEKTSKLTKEWSRIESNNIIDQFNFLKNMNISDPAAANIIELFGRNTISIANKNPYGLSAAPGVGFKTVDDMALKIGFPKESNIRMSNAINHVIDGFMSVGHTAVARSVLEDKIAKITGLSADVIQQGVEKRVASSHLVSVGHNIVEYSVRQQELSVASDLKRLSSFGSAKPVVANLENSFLNKEQREAVNMSLNNQVSILTGGPGTGKTTTVKEIISQHEKLANGMIDVVIVAPTGKAARRAGQAADMPACTIHSLLECSPDGGFKRNRDNPLNVDILVVDESSMMDLNLFSSLLKAMPDRSKLVLAGDSNQLPSVGPGNILSDLIRSNRLPVVELKEVRRQAKNSTIVLAAHAIKNGRMPPIPDNSSGDFQFIHADSDQEILDVITELNSVILPRDYGIRGDSIQVLSPQRDSVVGVNGINARLHDVLNPPSLGKYSPTFFGQQFRIGDRVMQMKNNKELDICNGEVGKITFFDYKKKEAWITFDGSLKMVPFAGFSDLKHAYASTIHKSQGSEYEAVIIPISKSNEQMLTRQLVYTGLTRGKKQVFFIGSEESLEAAIGNTRELFRNTTLHGAIVDALPALPKHEQHADAVLEK